MRKVMLVGIMMLTVLSLLATNFTMSGDFRTRMSLFNHWTEAENQSLIDSRAQLSFNAEIEKGLNFVYTLRTGDVVWGDYARDLSNNIDVKTHHAYVQWLCPFTGVDAKVGYQAWYDHMSLVMDDDFPAIIVTKENVIPNLTLQAGYAVLKEQQTMSVLSDEGWMDAEADSRFMMLNADHKLNESIGWGVNMLFLTSELIKEQTNFNMWFMPYFMFNQNGLNLDAMFAYNHGSYANVKVEDDAEAIDISNAGIAFAVKGSYDTQGFGVPAIDFLYTSGDDGEDPKSTSYFYSISNYYMNGLEIFGTGINDKLNIGFTEEDNYYGWFSPSLNFGLMSLVFKYSYPVTEKFEAKAAFGMLSVNVDKIGDYELKTDMATEIDLGFNYNIYKNYTFKTVGAMAMPGEFYGKDLENIYELSGVLEVKF